MNDTVKIALIAIVAVAAAKMLAPKVAGVPVVGQVAAALS